MTLTEFLLARITGDEARAKPNDLDWWGIVTGKIPAGDRVRVLAECAAKRRIIARHSAWGRCCDRCLGYADYTGDIEMETYPCQTLRYLAAVYADHPDYCNEWAPREA